MGYVTHFCQNTKINRRLKKKKILHKNISLFLRVTGVISFHMRRRKINRKYTKVLPAKKCIYVYICNTSKSLLEWLGYTNLYSNVLHPVTSSGTLHWCCCLVQQHQCRFINVFCLFSKMSQLFTDNALVALKCVACWWVF